MNDERDAKIAEYHALMPLRFPVVKSITFTQGVDLLLGACEHQHQLSLVFAMAENSTGDLLRLELFGVRGFVFEQPFASQFNLYLNIAKLEGADRTSGGFNVWSSEQDVKFACLCRDFIVANCR